MSPTGLSPNMLGSLYMAIGSLGYVVNDALIRAATDEGLDVYQSLFFRGVAMTVLFAAVIAGFVGVLIVVRPATDSFSWWSLAVVASAALMVVRELATRRVDRSTPALPIALLTAMGLTVLTGFISIFTGWGDVTGPGFLLVALACLCLVVGYVFTIETVRVGDLSVSAPFRYTTLVGAVLIGAVFFDEVPDVITLAGCLVIVLAGVVSIRLERRNRSLRPAATQL